VEAERNAADEAARKTEMAVAAFNSTGLARTFLDACRFGQFQKVHEMLEQHPLLVAARTDKT